MSPQSDGCWEIEGVKQGAINTLKPLTTGEIQLMTLGGGRGTQRERKRDRESDIFNKLDQLQSG